MANTYVTFSTDATNPITEYVIPFKFLKEEDVKVRSSTIANTAFTDWIYIPIATWNTNLVDGETAYPFGYYSVTFENGVNKIKCAPARPSLTGSVTIFSVTLYRRTNTTNSTYFSNGSPIQASDLNAILLQSLYNSEEALEAIDSINSIDIATTLNSKVNKAGDVLTGSLFLSGTGAITGATQLQLQSNGGGVTAPRVILQGGTIQGVPTPAYDTDAVNKAYVDTLSLPGTPITIADDSVTSEKLRKVAGEEAVTSTAIRALAVTSTKIASNAVTNDKIFQNAVSSVKIATGAVTSSKIAANAVTSATINAGAVIEDKIATGAVTNTKLGSNAVTNDKILTGTITSDKLANQTLDGATLIANASIPASKLNNSGLSWGVNSFNLDKTYVYTTAELIDAPSATINANNVIKKESLSYLGSQAVNNGRLALLDGSFKANASVPISSATLQQFQGVVPTFSVDTTPDGNGYYSYSITAENPYLLGKPFARTLIKWQGRAVSQNDYGSPNGNKRPTFFYKQIANIPFNYIIDNENPEISLNGTPLDPLTTSGEIVFNNSGKPAKKYFIRLSGFATSTRSGWLYIKTIGDLYFANPPVNNSAPKVLGGFFFDSTNRYRFFNISSVFNMPANTISSFPVQYYYSDSLNSAPTSSDTCGFGFGVDVFIPTSGVLAAPSDWMAGTEYRFNDSIVDLVIERIQ